MWMERCRIRGSTPFLWLTLHWFTQLGKTLFMFIYFKLDVDRKCVGRCLFSNVFVMFVMIGVFVICGLVEFIFHRGCLDCHSPLSFLYIFLYIDVGLCYLIPLSTIFHLFLEGKFCWWRNPEYPEKTIDLSLSHYVVSSTPRHEQWQNSQLLWW